MSAADFESKFANPRYLRNQQYQNSSNLSARVRLHQRFSTNPYGWYAWLFDQLLELPPQASILELGCGPGSFWPESVNRIPGGWQIFLSDFSAGMVQEASRVLEGSPRFSRFNVGDAQAVPFPENAFDAVIANHMLYHVPDRPKALGEIWRVLKPGGRLYAATNGQGHMQEIFALAQRFDPQIKVGITDMPFTLENGSSQLEPWFSDITTRLYEDGLRVTEAAPLLAYILSMTAVADANIPLVTAAAFSDFLTEEIEKQGAIYITKAAGLFTATKR